MDARERPVCVVLAPFDGAWRGIHDAVVDGLDQDGVDVRWLNGNAEVAAPTAAAMHEHLEQADVVVADVTENNPNVMYEMGFARAAKAGAAGGEHAIGGCAGGDSRSTVLGL